MRDEARKDYWEQRGLVLLWLAMLAGPIATALTLQVGYALVKWACATRHRDVLIIVTIGAVFASALGAALGWWCLEQAGATAADHGGRTVDRSAFLAVVSIGFNLLLALLAILWIVPPFILSPCE
jgi:hypothetical protein